MATVYSVRLAAEQGLDGLLEYTVDAGHVVVVRDIDVYQGEQLVASHFFFVGSVGQTIDFWEHGPSTGADTHQWRGRQVFLPGDTFKLQTDAAFDVTVSGYYLTI
jgi:hypothetical protein